MTPAVRLLKIIVALIAAGLAPSLFAETLSQPFFRIEVDNGWVYRIKKGPQTQDLISWGDVVSIHHPDRPGVLEIQSLRAPTVDPMRLREMTNVDWSVQLDWESWGDDFSGYQHSYSENGSFHRQWWLTDGKTIVFFVHGSGVESNQAETNEIDEIVRSIQSFH